MKNRNEKQDRIIGESQPIPVADAETAPDEMPVEELEVIDLGTFTAKAKEKEHTPVVVYGKVVKGKLNLRQEPNVSAKILIQIPNGDKVEILESKENWYNVKYQNFVGFVKSEFIQFI